LCEVTSLLADIMTIGLKKRLHDVVVADHKGACEGRTHTCVDTSFSVAVTLPAETPVPAALGEP
jgi:hypothetical protein